MNSVSFLRGAAFFLAALVFSMMPALGQDAAAVSSDYRVSPQDVLTIAVVGEKDLVQECQVTSSGKITYQWLSNFEVIGKTASEIEKVLAEALDKDYLVNPTVLVSVKTYRIREVNVIGQVNKPGPVALLPERPMSIVEAITKAGSFTARGNQRDITYTPRKTGKKQALKWDELTRTTDPSKTIYVEPGDIIEVGEKIL
jgi:protein involved in polysaccharide export with SLBB domain